MRHNRLNYYQFKFDFTSNNVACNEKAESQLLGRHPSNSDCSPFEQVPFHFPTPLRYLQLQDAENDIS